jgi:hypothetical protein
VITTCHGCEKRPPTTTILDRDEGLMFLCCQCADQNDTCPGCDITPSIECVCEPTPPKPKPIEGGRHDLEI